MVKALLESPTECVACTYSRQICTFQTPAGKLSSARFGPCSCCMLLCMSSAVQRQMPSVICDAFLNTYPWAGAQVTPGGSVDSGSAFAWDALTHSDSHRCAGITHTSQDPVLCPESDRPGHIPDRHVSNRDTCCALFRLLQKVSTSASTAELLCKESSREVMMIRSLSQGLLGCRDLVNRRQYPFLRRHALGASAQSQPPAGIASAPEAGSHPSAWQALEALHAVYEVGIFRPFVLFWDAPLRNSLSLLSGTMASIGALRRLQTPASVIPGLKGGGSCRRG